MKLRIVLSGTMVLALLIAILAASPASVDAFAGGDGTVDNPYQIENAANLQAVADNMSAHYIQVANIDCSGIDFEIIGDMVVPFTGTLDGRGYKITRLIIDKYDDFEPVVGLFRSIGSTGKLINVALEDMTIIGRGSVGGLAAANYGAIINSHVSGSVCGFDPSDSVAGGLVGDNGGIITNCYATGSVNGGYLCTGGLVGVNGGTITGSYATNSVQGARMVGGLAGSNSGTIINSYSTGNVSGGLEFVGGFVGVNGGTIINSYSTSYFPYFGDPLCGGFAGGNKETITDSFWDIDTSGAHTSNGGTSKTTCEMIIQNTFSNWDFSSAWTMQEGTTYPHLQWQTEPFPAAMIPTLDTDSDAVIDICDNCPNIANHDQTDNDRDGIGDACETGNPTPEVATIILLCLGLVVLGGFVWLRRRKVATTD